MIIATSNAGFGYEANLTEDADKPELMDRLKPYFRPEFLNRFNAVNRILTLEQRRSF